MKEIWKLLELLNEYERERVNHSMIDFIPYWEKSLNDLSVAQVISKKYWFIKWLVENDKIDIDKVEEKSEYTFIKNGWWEHIIEDVLMLLSISDTPIEDLISYLK